MVDRTTTVQLRPSVDSDLQVFFEQQLDPESNRMAAFAAKDPGDREKFLTHWAKLQDDPTVIIRTIMVGDAVAGYVASFLRGTEREVCYWLGKKFWGQGIATAAVRKMVSIVVNQYQVTALFIVAEAGNLPSLRLAERLGFTLAPTVVAARRAAGPNDVVYWLQAATSEA